MHREDRTGENRMIYEYFRLEWFMNTVKHVYNDQAYNEMTLITKHLGISANILYISL